MPNVKGSVLRSRLEFVRDHFGAAGVQRLLDAMPDEDRVLLSGGLLPAQWYPFALGERLDRTVMQVLGGGDPEIFRRLGRRSADLNLAGVHAVFVHQSDPQALLRRAPAIYKLYYDTGYRVYEKIGERSCRLTTHASDSYSEADCLTVIGWHERAVELCGGHQPRVEHPNCRARGAPVCEYLISWGERRTARTGG